MAAKQSATAPKEEARGVRLEDPRDVLLLEVDQLIIDSRSQRNTKQDRIDELSGQKPDGSLVWDWRRAETPTVEPMAGDDDHWLVIEGQHRVLSLKKLDPHATIWCVVVSRSRSEERSATAEGIAKGRRPHSQYEQWQLELNQGDPHLLAAQATLDALGLKLGEATSPRTLAAVASIRSVIRGGDPMEKAELLGRTLQVLGNAFTEEPSNAGRKGRFNGTLIRAVAEILRRNPHTDRQRLTKTLASRKSPTSWLQDAEGIPGAAYVTVGQSLLRFYNGTKSKGRLDW